MIIVGKLSIEEWSLIIGLIVGSLVSYLLFIPFLQSKGWWLK